MAGSGTGPTKVGMAEKERAERTFWWRKPEDERAVKGDGKRPTLPWAFLSAFPGVQPLSFSHVPPSGFWGRGELLALDPWIES